MYTINPCYEGLLTRGVSRIMPRIQLRADPWTENRGSMKLSWLQPVYYHHCPGSAVSCNLPLHLHHRAGGEHDLHGQQVGQLPSLSVLHTILDIISSWSASVLSGGGGNDTSPCSSCLVLTWTLNCETRTVVLIVSVRGITLVKLLFIIKTRESCLWASVKGSFVTVTF